VANGIRTHDLRNHNPADTNSNVDTGQQVTSSGSPACTNACTNLPENAQDEHASAVKLADLQQLELLAADAELRAVVDGWRALPDAVRVGIVAMVASCQPKGQVRGDKGEL